MQQLKATVKVMTKFAEVAHVEARTTREYQAQQGSGGAMGVKDDGFKRNEG